MPSQQNTEHVLFPFDNRALPFFHGVRLKMIPFASAADSNGLPNMVVSPGPDGTPDCKGILYYGTVLSVGEELWMWYLGQGEGAEQRRHFRYVLQRVGTVANGRNPTSVSSNMQARKTTTWSISAVVNFA